MYDTGVIKAKVTSFFKAVASQGGINFIDTDIKTSVLI